MIPVQNQTFQGTTEILDGKEYTNCQFNRCTLYYNGGELPRFAGKCHFKDCIHTFGDAAERTIAFLRLLHCIPGADHLAEKVIEAIRYGVGGTADAPPKAK